MQQDEQAAWDEAKRQAALDEAKRQAASDEDHSTVPFIPVNEAPGAPYADPTVAFPQGFQPVPPSYGQDAYGQNAYGQVADNAGYAELPQGTVYQGGVPPMLPPVPPSGQPSKPRSRNFLIAILAVLVLLILVVGGFLLLPALAASNHSQAAVPATPTPVSTPAVTPSAPAARGVYAPYLTQYRTGIRTQIAQGLHLTSAQLAAQLATGKTLSEIATAQGLTSAQLQTLITNSFQTGFQPAIDNGSLTQKQVDALIKRMLKQPKVLDNYLAVHAVKHAKATPTAVAS